MTTYAIGDVQGCFESLKRLLDHLDFNAGQDRLWLVGDLVNRGPRSLETLRFLRGLGDAAVCVLGNHDLHLLARAEGIAPPKDLDTLDDVLAAPDRAALIDWLAARPLLHQADGFVMVHAGLLPVWTVAVAATEARRIEQILRSPQRKQILGKEASPPALKALTTLRTCYPDGTPCKFNGAPADAPDDCMPWFSHPSRRSHGTPIIFGHWAALGVALGTDYLALDSGCVWGRKLTALRLSDRKQFSVDAAERKA